MSTTQGVSRAAIEVLDCVVLYSGKCAFLSQADEKHWYSTMLTSNQFTFFDFAPKLLFLFRFYFSVFDSRQKKNTCELLVFRLELVVLSRPGFLFTHEYQVSLPPFSRSDCYSPQMHFCLWLSQRNVDEPVNEQRNLREAFFFLLCVFCFAVTFSHFNSFIQTNVCYCYSTNILHQTVLSYWSDSF